jgi:hypothetical protein
MNRPGKLTILLGGIAVAALLTGCASYTRQETSIAGGESAPPDVASPSEIHSAPTVMTGDGLPQREHMLIYLDPWILGNN